MADKTGEQLQIGQIIQNDEEVEHFIDDDIARDNFTKLSKEAVDKIWNDLDPSLANLARDAITSANAYSFLYGEEARDFYLRASAHILGSLSDQIKRDQEI